MMRGGWHRAFDDPILLPDASKLTSLHDAATFITKLPKREHDTLQWQAVIEALMLVAKREGTTMMARIGAMRALNRHYVPEFVRRKKTRIGYAAN